MDEDGLGGIEERQGFLNAAARFEQAVTLVADADVEAEVVVGLEITDDLVGEMVNVHHDALGARCLQLHHDMPKQRLSPYPHQCLGHRVGERFEASAKTCSEDESVHRALRIKR